MRTICVLAIALLVHCGPRQASRYEQPDPQDSIAEPKPVEQLSGKVFVTGSEPGTSVTLVRPQGRGVTLVGDLQGELARLSGAEVRVHGLQGEKSPAGGFDVESYDVLEIDGEVPKVGILKMNEGTILLTGQDTVGLSDPPDELRNKVGAKVWIVGHPTGGKVVVQSYGIIREVGE